MADEERGSELPHRVRGAAGAASHPAPSSSPPALSEELRQRMEAAVKAEREQAAAKERQETAGGDVTSPPVKGAAVKRAAAKGAAGVINGKRKYAFTTDSASAPGRMAKPKPTAQPQGPAQSEPPAPSERTAHAAPTAVPERTTYPGPSAEDEITQWLGTAGQPQAAPKSPIKSPPAAVKLRTGRSAQPQTGAPKQPARRRSRTLLVTVIAAILVIGSLAVVVTKHFARSSVSTTASSAQLRQAAAVRDQAAAWVAQQVSRNVIVSCDRKMCAALTAHGFPANKLLVLGSTSPYPRSSAVVIQTAAVKDLFGSSLATAWAPVVLASFESGAAEITVRLIAPHGTAAYQSALSADLADRKTTGSSLLNDSRIAVSATAQKQLMAGQVDSRLLLAIASLATDHPIELVGFGNIAPGGDPDVPLRFADLAENDQSAHLTGAGYVKAMRASLATVNIQFRPASRTVTLPGGQTVLRVEFTAPSPLGLLGPQGSS
jgi:hypothetical protein